MAMVIMQPSQLLFKQNKSLKMVMDWYQYSIYFYYFGDDRIHTDHSQKMYKLIYLFNPGAYYSKFTKTTISCNVNWVIIYKKNVINGDGVISLKHLWKCETFVNYFVFMSFTFTVTHCNESNYAMIWDWSGMTIGAHTNCYCFFEVLDHY